MEDAQYRQWALERLLELPVSVRPAELARLCAGRPGDPALSTHLGWAIRLAALAGPGGSPAAGPSGGQQDPSYPRYWRAGHCPFGDDSYTIAADKPIGEGGYGSVWAARNATGFEYAIKLVSSAGSDGADRVRREMEGLNWSRQSEHRHIHIVDVIDYRQTADGLVVIMRRLDGTLQDHDGRGADGLPELKRLLKWIRQAAEALDFIREKGWQHRDVKLSNLGLLNDDVVLIDFSFARPVAVGQPRSSVYSPGYTTPEFRQNLDSDREDQFNLANCYYRLRTGQQPGLADPVEPADVRLPGVRSSFERRVIARAMHGDPAQRFASCMVFAAAATVAATGRHKDDGTFHPLGHEAAKVFGTGQSEDHRPTRDEYARGSVHRPASYADVLGSLRDHGCARVEGEGAAGKTVLAASLAFEPEFGLDGTYYLRLAGSAAAEADRELRDEVRVLALLPVLLVVDDAHLDEEGAVIAFIAWRDTPGRAARLLVLGRRTKGFVRDDGTKASPLGAVQGVPPAIPLRVNREDLVGVVRRLAARRPGAAGPLAPPLDAVDGWIRLFGKSLLEFGFAAEEQLNDFAAGRWDVRPEHARRAVQSRYLRPPRGASEPEHKRAVDALLQVASLAWLQLNPMEDALDCPHDLDVWLRRGVVYQIDRRPPHRSCSSYQMHVGLAKLLLAAAYPDADREATARLDQWVRSARKCPYQGVVIGAALSAASLRSEAAAVLTDGVGLPSEAAFEVLLTAPAPLAGNPDWVLDLGVASPEQVEQSLDQLTSKPDAVSRLAAALACRATGTTIATLEWLFRRAPKAYQQLVARIEEPDLLPAWVEGVDRATHPATMANALAKAARWARIACMDVARPIVRAVPRASTDVRAAVAVARIDGDKLTSALRTWLGLPPPERLRTWAHNGPATRLIPYLGTAGGREILAAIDADAWRVEIGKNGSPFIGYGKVAALLARHQRRDLAAVVAAAALERLPRKHWSWGNGGVVVGLANLLRHCDWPAAAVQAHLDANIPRPWLVEQYEFAHPGATATALHMVWSVYGPEVLGWFSDDALWRRVVREFALEWWDDASQLSGAMALLGSGALVDPGAATMVYRWPSAAQVSGAVSHALVAHGDGAALRVWLGVWQMVRAGSGLEIDPVVGEKLLAACRNQTEWTTQKQENLNIAMAAWLDRLRLAGWSLAKGGQPPPEVYAGRPLPLPPAP